MAEKESNPKEEPFAHTGRKRQLANVINSLNDDSRGNGYLVDRGSELDHFLHLVEVNERAHDKKMTILKDELSKLNDEIVTLKEELESVQSRKVTVKIIPKVVENQIVIEFSDNVEIIGEQAKAEDDFVIVNEMPFEKGLQILKDEILPSREQLSTIDIAEALSIPIEQAHHYYLLLLNEGLLKLD